MSAQATNSEEPKKDEPPQPLDDAKKVEEEEVSSTSPAAAKPGKKRRKLNDGSSSKTDEQQSTGFISSLSNFLSGTWFWPSSMPANDGAPKADPTVAAKAEDETKGEKEPVAESTKVNPKKITAPTEKTTDIKEKQEPEKKVAEEVVPKDSAAVTTSSVDSDDDKDDKADAKDSKQSSPDQKKKGKKRRLS